MTTTGAGRPRLSTRKRPGATARDEILDAAAELFTTRGFTSTTTRLIADAVGVRQASLYHHFATKDDMLAALLVGTVDLPLERARALRTESTDAVLRLYALAWLDASQLASSKWNLGALYLLPELAAERFESFRVQRSELMAIYAEFAAAAAAEIGVLADATAAVSLPFRLVESVINIRSDGDRIDAALTAATIADAAVLVLGWRTSTTDLADRTAPLLAQSASSATSRSVNTV